METRYTGLGKHFWGLAAGLIALLAGGWLMIAPYALGFQAYGAAWDDQMQVSFWTGLAVVIVALASLGAFMASLLGDLRQLGIIQKRPKVAKPAQAPAPAQEPAPTPAAGPADDDFERAMITLASALAEEMAERRKDQSGQDSQEQVRMETQAQSGERGQS